MKINVNCDSCCKNYEVEVVSNLIGIHGIKCPYCNTDSVFEINSDLIINLLFNHIESLNSRVTNLEIANHELVDAIDELNKNTSRRCNYDPRRKKNRKKKGK